MAHLAANAKPTAFDQDVAEEVALERLGYQQELKRDFSFIGMLAFSFSIVTSWSALSGVLAVGVESGGPPVMIWSWIGISAFSLAVAFSMAEMCSAYCLAGGQYSWCAVLAPKSIARGFSYVCGWFMLIGIISMGATNNFITANFVLGVANANNPDYVIERWHTVLVAYLVAALALSFNVFLPRLLDKISRGLIAWNICAFLIIVITILATKTPLQSDRFVFVDFVNLSGFDKSYTAIVGLLQAAFGLCCYDAPAHMTEELKNARKEAPRAIIYSVVIGAVTGFVFLIAACYCIGNIETTAASTTGVPIIQIFLDSTASRAGASCLTVLLIVIGMGASNALTAEGGRAVYAFARDHGLPFSGILSRVEKKKQIPVYALCLTVLVQIALNSIYFGTVTGFETVVSIATEGFYVSYAMPLLARLLSLFTSDKAWRINGLYDLGRWSVPLNVLGLLYLVFTSITFNFPTLKPVTSENMNYTCAAVGAIMLIALVTWLTTGWKHFKGPESGGVVIEGGEPHLPAITPEHDVQSKLGEKTYH
ncbi:putative GABA permease [Hortaea werneckii]|nr:putative GABA permease [Hortaea werneckii]